MSTAPSAATPPLILVAEDDLVARKLLTSTLERDGFRVVSTDNGNDALRLAIEQQPDLVILDIVMPGISGTETAALLRRESEVPFMFISALDQIEIVAKAIDEGALGYLVKPLELAQLLPTVRAALARAAELKRLRTTESNLSAALAVGRETSVAVGILMERHRLLQDAAFAALRNEARSQRRKVAEVAEQIIAAAELLNAPSQAEKPRKP